MASPNLPELLQQVGLEAFAKHFPVDAADLLDMDQDDLIDVAAKAGMNKDQRKQFLQVMASLPKQHLWKHFTVLMEEYDLSTFVDKIPVDMDQLLAMDEEQLKDVATDAGMKKDNRQRFLQLLPALRDRLAQVERSEQLRGLMKENGLSEFANSIQEAEKLLQMPDEELRDVAVDWGMAKDARMKFLQVLDMMRDKSSDSSTEFELVLSDAPEDLVNFLKKKNLEQYALKMFNHENGDYGQVSMLMSMTPEDLMAAAMDCGFAKEDRKKLGELVMEERQAILAEPSIGGKLLDVLRGAQVAQAMRVEKKNGLELAYLPFKETDCKEYMYSFGENIEPKQHRCSLRVMEAQIPPAHVEADVAKQAVILVVGQTGAGKSTQIDGMLNYLLDVKWEENIRFKVVDELQTVTKESLQTGGAASQTDAITAYKIPAVKGSPVHSNVTIVDTPGFGDTRGLHFDHKIVDQMKKFFHDMSEHVDILTGVCFVAPASAARLTESQQYVWNAILGLFGKDIVDNILLCFTFADGEKPQALEAVRAGGIPMRAFFKFNNSALFVDPNGSETDAVSKMFWDMGKKNMSDFFHSLSGMDPKSLHLSKQVMSEREQLEVTLENLGPQVKLTLGYANSLQQQAAQFALFDDQLEGAKDFKLKVQVPKFRKIPTSNNTTTCTECDKTCHNNCAFANDAQKANCCVMRNGYCTECPKKCHWSKHQNLPYILEWYMETQEKTLDDLKVKYDEANQGRLDKEKIMQGLLDDMKKSDQILAQQILKMKKCRERLNEIAMRPHTMPSEAYLQQLIENEKANQLPGWQGRVNGLEKLKTQNRLLKDAEDPEFSQKLVAQFTGDQKVQRAARYCKTKGGNNAGSWSRWMPWV